MIKILIMDDTPSKTQKIISVLVSKCLVNSENITVAKSINSGRRELVKNQYDILILDLVMPIEDNEPIEENGHSEKFIEEMKRVGRLKVPHSIIGLSQYQDKVDENADRFEKKIWKLIHYDLKTNDWEDLLQEAVDSIIFQKKQMLEMIKSSNRYDCGILCALRAEFEQMFLASGLEWKKFAVENTSFEFYSTEIRTELGRTRKIVATCGNMPGMQTAAVMASFMLSTFNLQYLFMTGFCAGFMKEGVSIGDIFVADSEFDYGAGKLVRNENGQMVLPEPKQLNLPYEITTLLNTYLREKKPLPTLHKILQKEEYGFPKIKEPLCHIRPGACGSYVVDDAVFMKRLLESNNRKLNGLDMEGYGLYMAGHILNRKCLLVKGIADYGDNKGDDYHDLCSFASAWFLFDFIKYSL